MTSPSSYGSLVVAAPSGSYGTGTPQRPLTIVTVHDDNWIPPFADTVNFGTYILFNILPPIGHSYRIWFSQITFLIEGYMATDNGANIAVFGYGSLMALENPSAETNTDAAVPEAALEINRASAVSMGEASSASVQLYGAETNYCEYPGGLMLPTGWGLSAYTTAVSIPGQVGMNSSGSSLVTVGYDVP